MPDERLDELVEASQALGPKMVKTKDVTIQTHDPVRVQKAKNMTRTKAVLLSAFPVTVVSPKHDPICCQSDDSCACD